MTDAINSGQLPDYALVSQALLADAKRNNFAGYDPFDGLNSSLFKLVPALKKGLFGLAWIQFHKRSPLNFRPLCGINKARNPKGVALFILGLLEDFRRTANSALLAEAIALADWLLTQQSDRNEWRHACWGYHFDWNARAFFVPKGKPNVITTIYVAKALYALSEVIESSQQLKSEQQPQALPYAQYRQAALSAADFIVETLYTEHEGRCFFAYIPSETAFVHNASLWGAAWVAFAGSKLGNTAYTDLALQVAWQSVREQAVDGSWVYGSRHHHQFIDGFHTGYNLEALDMIRQAIETNEFDDAIARGLAFYKTELFEADGTAKYYHNNRYPLDMHSVAQAVFTLLKVGGSAADQILAVKVIAWSLEHMLIPRSNQFVYQKNEYLTNKINYIRWTQAWVYFAFAFYQRHQQPQSVVHHE